MRGRLGWKEGGRVLTETLLLICTGLASYLIRVQSFPHSTPEREVLVLRWLFIAVTFQLGLYFRDVYDSSKNDSRVEFVGRLGEGLLIAYAALSFIYYMVPDIEVGRGAFLINVVLSSVFLVLWHVVRRLYWNVRTPRSNVIVIGTGRLARSLVTTVLHRPDLGLKIHGFVDDNPALLGASIVNPKVIGLPKDLPQIVAEHNIDRIIVELQDRRGRLPTESLLAFKARGIHIEDATTFYERVTGKVATENLKPSWLIFNSGFEINRRRLLPKQIVEFAISLILFIVAIPILLLAALLIKLDSRGPVFFRQERIGQNGRAFTLWKFRSMFQDAEKTTGPVWATKDDPRVTRTGKLLRRTRIDELPQLFSVLHGDMSLVGPRPERPSFVKELEVAIPYYHLRHSVKPGVTGWAQIRNGYANTLENTIEKLQYDLFYIKNMSPQLDAYIIFETIKTCLSFRGV